MPTAILLWIAGAVAATVVATVVFLFARQPRRPHDLGSVSASWTAEHNATTHGRDSS